MTDNAAKELGLSGRDVRHIPLLVFPKPKLVDNEWVDSVGIAFTNGIGELKTCRPVDFYFYLVDADGKVPKNFEFAEIQLNGETWEGIYIHPARGITVSFGENRKVVVMKDDLTHDFWRHPFSIAIRNTDTGELYELDPGTGNDGSPGTGGGPGG
jgi:hypothetical protein